MALDKRRAFALKKADQAIICFSDGDWTAGLAKAKAALELLETAGDIDPSDISILCGGVCFALLACNRIGEALAFYCKHAVEIADDEVKQQILRFWVTEVNSFVPGDVVQIGVQLVGVVVGPSTVMGRWRIRITSTSSEASGALGLGEAVFSIPEPAESTGEEVEVDEADMTLLSLKLSEEQRDHWRVLNSDKPELFGKRMKSDNEARWQRLFGAAARSQNSSSGSGIGTSASTAAQDLGLPLEQSFVATLYNLISDCLHHTGSHEMLLVDILGARPALELDDPETVLAALLRALPESIQKLTVRMCGPDVGCEDSIKSQEFEDGRILVLEIRKGLYHEAFPSAEADLIVAMNAGIGVPQYAAMWGPTLDLLASCTRRTIFALTSYTAGELLREESILRHRWGTAIHVDDDLKSTLFGLLHVADTSAKSYTLTTTAQVKDAISGEETTLCRGDVIEPAYDSKNGGQRITSLKVLRCSDFLYVGPNSTPGRNRNFGKLMLWVGGPKSTNALDS